MSNQIAFWHHDCPDTGWLSNLYISPILIDGVEWSSSEHYYQAMKHDDPEIIEKVRLAPTGIKSKHLSRKFCNKLNHWPSVEHKVSFMRKAIEAKFTQNPDLKAKLLDTDGMIIVENSPQDSFWGIGKDGDGVNMMGLLLMELRCKLS